MTLKFRAWLIKEKKMVGVSDLLLAGGGIIQTSCEDSDYDGLSKVVGRDCVLMQSTGMKDVHGKEIYEGDVVKGIDYCSMRPYYIEKVEYWGDSGVYSVHELEDLEVLGNVYENPELSKQING